MGYFQISENKQAEILKLLVMELWAKLQAGQLTAVDGHF